MSINRWVRSLILWAGLTGVALFSHGCGTKDLFEVFTHPSVDERVTESLSGNLYIPTPRPSMLSDPDKFSFVVISDTQIRDEGRSLVPKLKDYFPLKNIKFVLIMGDLTEDATPDEFDKIKAIIDALGIPVYSTIGNHDLFQKQGWPLWKAKFGAATYSVSIGNGMRVIMLDTADGKIGESQFRWLEEQLRIPYTFTLIGSHYPIYDGVDPFMWRLESTEERYKLTSMIVGNSGLTYFMAGHLHAFSHRIYAGFNHFIVGSMYPYDLDFGDYGFVLMNYDHGNITWEHLPLQY
jgi:3',5'-cyclic AMP phosphodiesterase CpdA